MNQPPSQVDTKVNRRHEIKEVQKKLRTVKKKGRAGESKRELRGKTKRDSKIPRDRRDLQSASGVSLPL